MVVCVIPKYPLSEKHPGSSIPCNVRVIANARPSEAVNFTYEKGCRFYYTCFEMRPKSKIQSPNRNIQFLDTMTTSVAVQTIPELSPLQVFNRLISSCDDGKP